MPRLSGKLQSTEVYAKYFHAVFLRVTIHPSEEGGEVQGEDSVMGG